MPDENIEVIHSEEGGNGLPEETPSGSTETVIPAETTEAQISTEPELYELPDGRKVDAETLSREWKENFYPDYTRKSQALAAKDHGTAPQEPTIPELNDEWVPKTYAEIVQIAKQEFRADLSREQQEAITRQQEIETNVSNEIADIKKIDPAVNMESVFLHANKYGFNNLQSAYQNMKDMNQLAKNIQQTTVQNITRRTDPVSISTGNSGGVRPDPSQFATATDYLRSLQ